MRELLEYAAVWTLLKTIGAVPRPLARFTGARLAAFLLWLRPGLRGAAMENLLLAFPDWNQKQRRAALRGMVRQLGWMGAEFAHFPRYTKGNIERVVLLDGFENFAAANKHRGPVPDPLGTVADDDDHRVRADPAQLA